MGFFFFITMIWSWHMGKVLLGRNERDQAFRVEKVAEVLEGT